MKKITTKHIKSSKMLLIKFQEKRSKIYEYYISPEDLIDELYCLKENDAKKVEVIDWKGNIVFDEFGFLPLERESV